MMQISTCVRLQFHILLCLLWTVRYVCEQDAGQIDFCSKL